MPWEKKILARHSGKHATYHTTQHHIPNKSKLHGPQYGNDKAVSSYTMKAIQGTEEIHLHSFLTLTLDRGKWLASHPSLLNPGKESQQPMNRKLGRSTPELVWTFWRR
jgi:hypothetical protein